MHNSIVNLPVTKHTFFINHNQKPTPFHKKNEFVKYKKTGGKALIVGI